MRILFAVGVLAFSFASCARATEWLECSDGDKASFRVLLGQMSVIAVNDIVIEVGSREWSTTAGKGTLITKGQAFETTDQILIDATDEAFDKIVARLRVFKASDKNDDVTAGTLQMPDVGVWAVTCTGP